MLRDDAYAVRKRFTDEILRLPSASAELVVALRRGCQLRDFCRRIFGWDDARREAVDGAVRTLLAAEEVADGLQGQDRADTDDLGGMAEVRRTADATGIDLLHESRLLPTEGGSATTRRRQWRRSWQDIIRPRQRHRR